MVERKGGRALAAVSYQVRKEVLMEALGPRAECHPQHDRFTVVKWNWQRLQMLPEKANACYPALRHSTRTK